MTNCDDLRSALWAAKRERNEAQSANALAENGGRPLLFSPTDMEALRLRVDMAALEARTAGCDIDDIVGPNIGNFDP